MIRLEISGDTAHEFGTQLAAVAQLMAGSTAGVLPAAEPEDKPKRGRPKAADTPAPSEDKPSPTGDAATASGAGKSDISTAENAGGGDVTRDSVAKKCTAYGQPSKGGPAALKELFLEMGAANGKWSEVPDENLLALNARLDELLA